MNPPKKIYQRNICKVIIVSGNEDVKNMCWKTLLKLFNFIEIITALCVIHKYLSTVNSCRRSVVSHLYLTDSDYNFQTEI